MRKGFLSQYFTSIAAKKLSSVEVNPKKSNQHEFNGSKPLKKLFGESRIKDFPVTFVWLGGENEAISEDGFVTWYDARENHPTRSEFRLYFKPNSIINMANQGDLLIVAKRANDSVFIFVVETESTLENQILWLFGLSEHISFDFNFQPIEEGHDPKVDFAVRYILEEIGIEIEEPDNEILDNILEPYFNTGFPSTNVFSSLARETAPEYNAFENPDLTLLKWMEQEEKLFKRLERYLITKRFKSNFKSVDDFNVEDFVSFSKSVLNRRKSRVGYAFENHLEEIFKSHDIRYSRNMITENKSRPDFIFPNIEAYQNPKFSPEYLTMLGVKSTCKDRWRQVLSEAARIDSKHLLTLEPGISENQTNEMQSNLLQLVLPKPLHKSYTPTQQSWLLDLKSFIELVKERQSFFKE